MTRRASRPSRKSCPCREVAVNRPVRWRWFPLLLACLHDMRAQGYTYGVIGGTGPQDFYAKVCGAPVIPDSKPGMYAGLLR